MSNVFCPSTRATTPNSSSNFEDQTTIKAGAGHKGWRPPWDVISIRHLWQMMLWLLGGNHGNSTTQVQLSFSLEWPVSPCDHPQEKRFACIQPYVCCFFSLSCQSYLLGRFWNKLENMNKKIANQRQVGSESSSQLDRHGNAAIECQFDQCLLCTSQALLTGVQFSVTSFVHFLSCQPSSLSREAAVQRWEHYLCFKCYPAQLWLFSFQVPRVRRKC